MNNNEMDYPMPITVSVKEALSLRLGVFRPSDREELTRAFSTSEGQEAVYQAVVLYVEGWEKSDWLEEYSIERIGKWIGKNAPDELILKLLTWANSREEDASAALLLGINQGQAANSSKH